MESCEVLVVGGGPAGSSCAAALAAAGVDALVLDKRRFPREKVCAGWITPRVVEALELDLEDYARGRTLQPVRALRTGVLGGRPVETRYARPVGWGIRRAEFDHYLLARSGARLRLGEGARSIMRAGCGWLVNGSIRARMLVGAGGHFCPVARLLARRATALKPAVTALAAEIPLGPEQLRRFGGDPEAAELFFCRDLRGYAWCLRKGGFLNLGIGRSGPGLRAELRAFLRRLREEGRLAGPPPELRGHAYLLDGHGARACVADGALLAGDSAGLAWRESGEGIGPAVESGLSAARTILRAGGDYREANLAGYREALALRAGQEGVGPALPAPRWLAALAGRGLLRSAWFSRRVVESRFLRAG